MRVFNYDDTDWVQLGEDIDGEAANDWLGISVSTNIDPKALLRSIGLQNGNVNIIRNVTYKFQNRIANTMSLNERFFLMGDAAHCMSPFKAQGLNSGIRDVFNLSWK